MIEAPDIDLSTIPIAQSAVVVALMKTIAALQEITRRRQHLIAEMNHTQHGKRSEKLAEVGAEKETHPAKAVESTNNLARQRTIGNLPAALPRVEEVIEPDSLTSPCDCENPWLFLHAKFFNGR